MASSLLLTCGEYAPGRLLTHPETRERVEGMDIYDLELRSLDDYTAILIPIHADQRYLVTQQGKLEAFLARGGTLVICGHVMYPFLPELTQFVPMAVRSVEDYRVWRVREHPIFAGVDTDDLTFRKGVAGFYGRGHNPPPPYAQILHRLGSPDGVPADFVYQRPGGGRVFVHGGNNLWMISLTDEANSARHIEPQLLDWIEAPPDLHAMPDLPATPDSQIRENSHA